MNLQFFANRQVIECHYEGKTKTIPASSVVRNELNGWRAQDDPRQVVLAITEDPYRKYPVMPRPYPRGKWNVYRPLPRTDPYKAPYYIPTDAEQMIMVWDLDEDGSYGGPTGEMVRDIAYGLHCSSSNTTVGCIKIHNMNDLLWLVQTINTELDIGEFVTITA